MKKFLLKYYPLLIILSSALALRINLLFHRGTFWFDEKFSTHYSTLPSWADTIKYWTMETNPPLFTFLLRLFIPLTHTTNETIMRLPSLFFSVLSVILLYIFTEKLFSRPAAIISTIFLSLSSLHMVASTEVRTYSLLVFLTILSCFLFHRIVFEKKQDKKTWIFYTLTNLLLIYAHLTAPIIVLVQFFIINLVPNEKNVKKYWYISQITAGFLWLIWFIPSISYKLNLSLGTAWYFDSTPKGSFLIGNLLMVPFIHSMANNLINTLFLIAIFAGIYVFVKDLKTVQAEKRNLLLFIALWALIPIFFSSILGVFIPKYVIIAYPGLYMLAGYILGQYAVSSKKLLIIIAIIFIVVFPISLKVSGSLVFSWHEFNNYIKKNETKNSIVLLPFTETLSLRDYYNASSPLIGLYLNKDNMPYEERIARYNWNQIETNKEQFTEWVNKQIKDNHADKIFLIQQFGEQVMIHEILLENGWVIRHKERAPGYYNYYLYEFSLPDNKTAPVYSIPANR